MPSPQRKQQLKKLPKHRNQLNPLQKRLVQRVRSVGAALLKGDAPLESLEDLKVEQFPLWTFTNPVVKMAGCGATALGFLTGINPLDISAEYPNKMDNWNKEFMISFLKKKGYFAVEVDSKKHLLSRLIFEPISENHVILWNARITREEASWFVSFRDKVYHNFEDRRLDSQMAANLQRLTQIIVCHPSWRKQKAKEEK